MTVLLITNFTLYLWILIQMSENRIKGSTELAASSRFYRFVPSKVTPLVDGMEESFLPLHKDHRRLEYYTDEEVEEPNNHYSSRAECKNVLKAASVLFGIIIFWIILAHILPQRNHENS